MKRKRRERHFSGGCFAGHLCPRRTVQCSNVHCNNRGGYRGLLEAGDYD